MACLGNPAGDDATGSERFELFKARYHMMFTQKFGAFTIGSASGAGCCVLQPRFRLRSMSGPGTQVIKPVGLSEP